MEAMRNTWTDERLDDGFDRVSAEMALVRGEVGEQRAEMKAEFKAVRSDMATLRKEMHDGFTALNRTLLQIAGGILAALVGGIVAALGLLATQL